MRRLALALSLLLALAVSARASAPTTRPAVPPPPILWLTIAGSADAPADRNVGWNIKRAGWSGFVREVARPAIKRYGVRRILLHNPFGARPDEGVFQFDQYLAARDAGLKWLANGFSTAWRPVTRDGIEVIAYVGMLQGDPDFKSLPPDEWVDRALSSVRPLLDAGCSIALDVGSHAPDDSPPHRFAELLLSLGVKVYLEPRPRKDCPGSWGFPIVSEEPFWRRSDPDVYADSRAWAARNADLAGEKVLFIRGYSQSIDAQREQVARVRDEGNTPAVELPYFEGAVGK